MRCGLTLAALSALAGCSPHTLLVVGIATDMPVPAGLDEVELAAHTQGDADAMLDGGDHALPGDFVFYTDDNGLSPVFDFVLHGKQRGMDVMQRPGHTAFVSGEVRFLRIGITDACRHLRCPDGTACVEGRCTDPSFGALPPYHEGMERALDCASGTAFVDTASGARLPAPASCPAGNFCRDGTCYPGTAPAAWGLLSWTSTPLSFAPGSLAAGDFDGDGALDLVVADMASGTLTSLRGHGDGTFQPGPTLLLPSNPVAALAVADFDGDGIDDLAAAAQQLVLVPGHRGTGLGSPLLPFAQPITHLVAADLDGDGAADLAAVSAGEVLLLRGDGHGGFGSSSLWAPAATVLEDLAAGDLDRDGRPDLVVVATDNVASTLMPLVARSGFGEGQRCAFNGGGLRVALGDLNGDGHLDAVTNAQPTICFGDGSGKLINATSVAGVMGGFDAIGLADVDGDGLADLVGSSHDGRGIGVGTLALNRGMGGPALASPSLLDTTGGAVALLLRDLDGDGRADAVLAITEPNGILTLRNGSTR